MIMAARYDFSVAQDFSFFFMDASPAEIAFRRRLPIGYWCIVAASAFALIDELNQMFSPGHHPSLIICGTEGEVEAFSTPERRILIRAHRNRDVAGVGKLGSLLRSVAGASHLRSVHGLII